MKTKNKPMKTSIKNPFPCLGVASMRSRVLPLLIAGLGLIPAGRVTAQTLTTLHSFTETSGPTSTNSDGANPQAGLILSGTTLYGTAYWGGSSGYGTVFSLSLGSVSAPQLTIIRSGANVILTWPTNATGFNLQ